MTRKSVKPRKLNAVDQIMAEVINYGGIACPRGVAYQHALECAKSKGASNPARCADLCTMIARHVALSSEEASRLIPLEYARAHGLLD